MYPLMAFRSAVLNCVLHSLWKLLSQVSSANDPSPQAMPLLWMSTLTEVARRPRRELLKSCIRIAICVFGFLSLWSDRSILVLSLRVSELARLLLLGSFEEELAVMADVRAYYHVAYKRIVDHIPFRIEHALHHALDYSKYRGALSITEAISASSGAARVQKSESDGGTACARLRISI